MFTELEEINNDLKGLSCISFALAEQADGGSVDADALMFVARSICDVQKRSEAIFNEYRAEKKRGDVA